MPTSTRKNMKHINSAVGQMTLCFTEVFVFLSLAILSKFIGEKIFIIIFILSIISTIGININIKLDKKERENKVLQEDVYGDRKKGKNIK